MARVFTDGGAMTLASAAQSICDLDSFSASFWIFRTATPAVNRGILGADDGNVDSGWFVGITTANLIQGAFIYSTTTKFRVSTTVPTLNGWMHVVVAHKFTGTADTDFTFYFNGKSEAGTASATGAGSHVRQAVPFTIGSGLGGELAAPVQIGGPVAVWSRAISPTEALALAGGAHPLRFKEGLVEIFEMNTAHGELGMVSNIYIAQGATNPTSAAVNPPTEQIPSSLYVNRQNYQTRRARYTDNGVVGPRPKVHRLSQAVKRSAYY